MVLNIYVEELVKFCDNTKFSENHVYYVINLFKQIYYESREFTIEYKLKFDVKEKELIRKRGMSLDLAVDELERFFAKRRSEGNHIGTLGISFIKDDEIHYTPEKSTQTKPSVFQVQEEGTPVTNLSGRNIPK